MAFGSDPWQDSWTPRRLASAVLDRVRARQSLLLLHARDRDLRSLLLGFRAVFRREGATAIHLVQPEADQALLDTLVEHFSLSGAAAHPSLDDVVAGLSERADLQQSVLWVRTPNPDWLAENLGAIERIARLLSEHPGHPPVLLIPHPGTRDDVSEFRVGARTTRRVRWGPHLDAFLWQGWCASLDARMALEEHPELEPGLHRPLIRRLLASVALEVGLWDAELREALLQGGEAAAIDPTPVVEAFRRARWGAHTPGLRHDQRSWVEGAWERWDGVPRSHSCALVVGDGRHLRRRIWRAHLLCIFPLLEELRPLVVDEIRSAFWRPLMVRRDGVSVAVGDPHELEWGDLSFHLRDQASRRHPKWSVVEELRLLRNALAHRQPVDAHLLRSEALLAELERVL